MKKEADFRVLLVILFLAVALSACNRRHPTALSPAAYVQYLENEQNGYKKIVASGPLRYTIQYRPSLYTALKEVDDIWQPAAIYQRAAQFTHTAWFSIQLTLKDNKINPLQNALTSQGEYSARVAFFTGKAQKDITLKYDGKAATQIAYYFENNDGLTPTDAIIVGFSIPDSAAVKNIQLAYLDEVFHGGIIKSTISKEELLAIPNLSFHE